VVIAGGYSLSTVLNVFINAYYTKKMLKYGAWQQLKDILPYLIAGIPMGLIILTIKLINIQSTQLELLISILAGGIGYLSICWCAKLDAITTLNDVFRINKKRSVN
jgi:hypothetical protein